MLNAHPRRAAAVIAAAAIALCSTPGGIANAQIPSGMNLGQMNAVLAAPIAVAPGETTTVDLGVPVQGGYSGEGWDVHSAGTVVTVTAPETPGASTVVSFNALGQTRQVTLVTEQGATLPDPAASPAAPASAVDPAQPEKADEAGENPAPAPGTSESAVLPAAMTPPRQPAEHVDTAETRYIDLPATIDGNFLTVKLGAIEAANLMREFNQVDQEGVTLRYVDVNNQVIENVQREINTGELSMTLTYPEGQTPDNPFLIQVIGPGNVAHAIVRLTAAETEPAARTAVEAAAVGPDDAPADSSGPGRVLVLGGALAALLLLGLALTAVFRRAPATQNKPVA